MLNIGKLVAGGGGYYLHTVASGVEDYYTGAGEAPGYWLGAGSADLGLEGTVEAEALRAVLGALDPASGDPLGARASRRSVPGFDLTFRAPKSVSLLYGLADPETSRAVRDAHDAAVAAAVGYLERHAASSRRGHGGAERVPVSGFAAAAFRHRTSRAGDPLLHTHVLVANLARARDDGRWRTLDGRRMYAHAKTAGYLYQVQLRAELTRRLGVQWRPVRNGCADLAGVPDELIRAFSRRRAEIEAHMAPRGESSARAAQVATLATRRAKPRDVDGAVLGIEWQTRAAALEFNSEQVAALVGRTTPARLDPAVVDEVARELTGPDGLTAHASTFTRRDTVRAWCERVPAGVNVDDVLDLTDHLLRPDRAAPVVRLDRPEATGHLAAPDVTRREDGRFVPAEPREPRYSTPELMALEQQLVTHAAARQQAGAGRAGATAVEAALTRRATMSREQAAMVRRLTTSGAGVEVVVGKAGAGKTFALDAAREAWQASGLRVAGCALAARAAAELQAGSGIPSSTIDSLLAHTDRHPGGLAAGSVLVVDEAGMVGTRKLARLLDLAGQAGAKIVLVGDHHQLPEIDAGGAFRSLVERLPAVELADNRRQHATWERAALDELRHGDPAAALDAYTRAGRVHVGATADAAREQLVADWWAARRDHAPETGVMIALRASDVEDLNRRARSRLAAVGQLTGPAVAAACGREFRVGDHVVCLRNDRRLGVVNGTRATVTGLEPGDRRLTVQIDGEDRAVRLPAAYLDEGHVAHAYAITAHKAQGLTTERTWVLGSDTMYREWGYVALSRGRRANDLYLVAGDDAPEDPDAVHGHSALPESDPLSQAAVRLTRSRAARLALDEADTDATGGGSLAEPAALQRIDRQLARLQHARDRAARASEHLGHELATAGRREGAAAGRRRSPLRGARQVRAETARLSGDRDAWQARIDELDAAIGELSRRRALMAVGEGATPRQSPPPVDKSKVQVRSGQHQEDDLGIGIS